MTTLGEAIHNVRLSTGMSQADLAARAGLTQATLSRYESDVRNPDTQTLTTLAAEMGVAHSLLKSPPTFHGALALPAHMGRRGSAKATLWRGIQARLNIIRIHVHRLADVADLRFDYAVPRLDPSALSASEAARRVRTQWDIPPGPIEGIVRSMEDAGCFIASFDFGSQRADALSQWVETYPVVAINSGAPAERNRLTLAHELGHLVLHSSPESVSNDVEREAADFAAAFLLPERDVRDGFNDMSLTALHDLKMEWGVPMRTLVERAHTLRVIDDRRLNSIHKMLSRRGWLSAEPPGDVSRLEEPLLLDRVVAALEAKGYSEYAVAAIGGFSDVTSASRVLPLERP